MKTAIYPGSFDPVSLGHLNVIERISEIFDRLVVCVMVNSDKNPLFSPEERVDLIKRVTKHLPNIEIDLSDRLLADYADSKGSCVIVKGLRAVSDFDKEFQMALINSNINPNLDTIFLSANQRFMFLSSSVVKEMARYDVDLSAFVPAEIIDDIKEKMKLRRQK